MLSHRIHRILDRVQLRFVRSRPGSVLILVIVLLVLMALLGTAFLVTARNDRVTSKLFMQNRQIDLLVEGVKGMALAAMTNNSQRYDDYLTAGANGTVDHSWLAARYPAIWRPNPSLLFSDVAGVFSNAPAMPVPKGALIYDPTAQVFYLSLVDQNIAALNTPAAWAQFTPPPNWMATPPPIWPAVSGPLSSNGFFEDPRYPIASPIPTPVPAGSRTVVSPTFVPVNGVNYPALQYWSIADNQMETALAASASGNGIADSFLWRLPMNTIDGVTYYAAVRIIDNNSAIDANTALSSSFDYDANGNAVNTPGFVGLLPSGIGLTELLYSYYYLRTGQIQPQPNGAASDVACPEMAILNQWRFAGFQRPQGIKSTGNSGVAGPLDDGFAARGDFYFGSVGDALTMMLGRRSFNPGIAVPTGLSSSGQAISGQARSFTWGDAAALAYKFDLANSAGPGTLESCLINSTYNAAGTPVPGGATAAPLFPPFRATPWDPSQAAQWFADNYPDETQPLQAGEFFNRRPYITAHSNLSNLMPSVVLPTAANLNKLFLTSAQISQIAQGMVGTSAYANSTTVPRCSLNTAPVTMYDFPPGGLTMPGPTLWYGFYQAMLGVLQLSHTYNTLTNPPTLSPPTASRLLQRPWGAQQFRSPIRDLTGTSNFISTTGVPKYYLSGGETVALRALLAACNARELRRDGDSLPTVENVPFTPFNSPPSPMQTVVRAFGIKRQPFIAEVYANNDSSTSMAPTVGMPARANAGLNHSNPKGYVAVELYNPYDTPISIAGWTLGILNRTNTSYPKMQMQPISPGFIFVANGASGNATIPAGGYLILQNYNPAGATGNDATWLPYMNYLSTPTAFPAASCYYVPNLNTVMQDPTQPTVQPGGELYLLRPPSTGSQTQANWNDWQPIDSFDFTGLIQQPSSATTFNAIHYVRPTLGPAILTALAPPLTTAMWKFVYPGNWDPGTRHNVPANPQNVVGAFSSRQDGIAVSGWKTDNTSPAVNYDYWIDNPPGPGNPAAASYPANTEFNLSYGAPMVFNAASVTATTALSAPSYGGSYANNFAPIQLANRDMPGPNKISSGSIINGVVTTPATNLFPFGGFARVGDVMSVPFIGSYAIVHETVDQNGRITIADIVEMNPVTRDAALADDDDSTQPTPDDKVEQIGRFCPIAAAQQSTDNIIPAFNPPINQQDRYGFAANIMDYFSTINNPNDDYLPNIDPYAYTFAGLSAGTFPQPYPVANTLTAATGGPNKGTEDTVPMEGLINVNTANWRALAAVPFVPTNTAAGISNNQLIAQAIVRYRNTYGPFKTLFDLNKVPISGTQTFQNYGGDPTTTDFGPALGDISPVSAPAPGGATTDNVTNDFETRFGMINRVSNLLTTRSDTFTVYLVVQGWKGVGTSTPQIALQRRAAFIVDRSQLSATNSTMNITPLQTN